MDDRDTEKEIQELARLLARVDERTERMDRQLVAFEKNYLIDLKTIRDDVSQLNSKVARNTTVLSGISLGLGSLATVVLDKIFGLL
jgi:hypothetical protein